jgi:hypothetical protein
LQDQQQQQQLPLAPALPLLLVLLLALVLVVVTLQLLLDVLLVERAVLLLFPPGPAEQKMQQLLLTCKGCCSSVMTWGLLLTGSGKMPAIF